MRSVGLIVFLLCACVPARMASADAGVFFGSGQNLKQISSAEIHLSSIDVNITLGRGMFLFDGSVKGMDQAEFRCKFTLHNRSGKSSTVKVGFPINSQFLSSSQVDVGNPRDWVLKYDFIALDDTTTYNVGMEKFTSKDKSYWTFTWPMNFGPDETRVLTVQYRIPVSASVSSTDSLWKKNGWQNKDEDLKYVFLRECSIEFVNYVTFTGASWSGKVDKATFAITTGPFEKYLDRRGFDESDMRDGQTDQKKNSSEPFPIKKGMWFRSLAPEGWKVTEQGVQWTYSNYEPSDDIMIVYYYTQLPQEPGEVGTFVESMMRSIKHFQRREVSKNDVIAVRDILMSAYGVPSGNPETRKFIEAQVWYEPTKVSGERKLSPKQERCLEEYGRLTEHIK